MTTLTATRAAQLPRVNLLPPEIAAAAGLARTKRLLGVFVVAALALVGLGFVWANSQVASAQAGLDTAASQHAALQQQAAQYAKVPQVNAELTVAQQNLATAMAPEVRVSFLMNDLSLTIPGGVRLSGMTIGIGPSDPNVQAATTAATTDGQAAPQLAGSLTYTGKAHGYDRVAAWLASFNHQAAYANPYLSTVAKDTDTTSVGTTYTFTSTAQLTEAALSNRYTKAGQ